MANGDYATIFNHNIPLINSIPYLYRYEDQKWIDEFFDKGNLLISSFKNYKSYKDNQIGDKFEGNSYNVLQGANDKFIGTYTMVGQNQYCFCTSTVLSDDLKPIFKRNSVFRIKDALNFMIEITRSLPRVQNVLFGNCIYINERIIQKSVPSSVDMEQLKDDEQPNKLNLQKMMAAAAPSLTKHRYFLKLIEHQEQSEYRILWTVDRKVEEGIVIKCPEAVRFCEEV